jgi:biopolymer transport protein ExbB
MFDILIKGGWIMLPLALCSSVAVTIIVERLLFFKRVGAAVRADEVIQMIKKGKINEALEITKGAKSPLLKVLSAGIANPYNRAKAMETVAITEVSIMKRGVFVLDTIITLSPLLGLLGTIIGMINSFQVMAVVGLGQPHAVTGGIAEALIATATGITVAIITLIPYNYFLACIERETDVIGHYATQMEMVTDILPRSDTHENTKKYA